MSESNTLPRGESCPVGVCVLKEPDPNRPRTCAYPNYLLEIFAHAGICHAIIAPADLAAALPSLRLLVTVGDRDFDPAAGAALQKWVEAGNAWISIGGTCGMHDLLGAARAPGYQGWGGGIRTLGEGYLVAADPNHPITAHAPRPLHYFNGIGVQATTATVLAKALDAHGRATEDPVLLESRVGDRGGRALLIAPDLTGSVVLIQQGIGVTRDGIPSPDGNAPVTDGVLKSGDGAVLDWLLDREPLPGAPNFNAYTQPVADQWRELLIRGVLHLATELNVPLPVLWLYPRNLPALGLITHDTDNNEPAKARRLLEQLKKAEIFSTWCVIAPGYDRALIGEIRDAGHELAMHYDAMSPGLQWSEAEFDRQWNYLKDLLETAPVTNKNHYTRWEGDTEFFDWCVKRGIAFEQSKGASKPGEAPFNFGTCHPHRPVRFDGSFIDVLELPTVTQDLHVFAPEPMGDCVLSAAEKHHGVAHLLFHPAHFGREEVCEAIVSVVRKGRQRGMEWWTARQVNDWERARRTVSWSGYRGDSAGGASVTLTNDVELPDATVLWLTGRAGSSAGATRRWGFTFAATTATLAAGKPHLLVSPTKAS